VEYDGEGKYRGTQVETESWSGEWAPTKLMSIRDIRLSSGEWLTIAVGLLLIIVGAYRETLMAFGQL
jgi:hypothetical protein